MTGAQGSSGDLVVGPTGVAGPAGPAGAAGSAGPMGARGESGAGYAGAVGQAGPAGERGPTGDTGPKGPTLVGPAGPAGAAGGAGQRGGAGVAGSRGATTEDVAGAVGASGPAGPRGDVGPAGQRGTVGVIDRWVAYREVWFDQNATDLHEADKRQFAGIAAYMRQNPSLEIGIDGSGGSTSGSRGDNNLRANRAEPVRDAMVSAGVPTARISEGNFAEAGQRRDGRVAIMVRTDREQQSGELNRNANSNQDRNRGMDRNQDRDLDRDMDRDQNSNRARSGVSAGALGSKPSRLQIPSDPSERWTTLQSVWFDNDSTTIHDSDRETIAEVATYMKSNPAMRIGIDSSAQPSDRDSSGDGDLASRRGTAVRSALINAGVPAASIESGTFGDRQTRWAGCVELLVRAERVAQAK